MATSKEWVASLGYETGVEYRFVIAVWGEHFSGPDVGDRAPVYSNVWTIAP